MKKQFRALSLCLTLALCVFGSTAALAELPPQRPPLRTNVSSPM